jgi:glycosyltransferase involved in cell wall biosynthesis
MTRSVGVVIPAYRPDADILASYARALHERLAPAAIRVELDGPADALGAALDDAPSTVEVNAVDERRGKGAAVTDGFEALVDDVDVLAFVDADGSTPVDSVADVVAPVRAGSVDLAVGSRRHPDATVQSHQTLARRRLGDGFAWLARRLLDVRLYDYQCGTKAIDSGTWREVRSHLYEPGFAWDIELVAVTDALGHRIREVPVDWQDRPGSTVSPVRTTLRLARGLVVARHRARLLGDDAVHSLIDRNDRPPALVDRARTAGGHDVEER